MGPDASLRHCSGADERAAFRYRGLGASDHGRRHGVLGMGMARSGERNDRPSGDDHEILAPVAPEGWFGIDTRFRCENGQYADYAQQLETIGRVMEAAGDNAQVIVLPESSAGIWTPTTARLWSRALDGGDLTVIAGAIIVDPSGYDNAMIEISGEGSRILYRERMPVPVSMWQPWRALIGEPAGARAHFFDNPAVEIKGRRIAPLICYEQLVIWPVLQSALRNPDVIVATGNGWWTENTNIVAIQRASAVAWARLFSRPLIISFNS